MSQMAKENPRRLIGELLVKKNMISEEQLREALRVQTEKNQYLGEVLVYLGFATEEDILSALLLQCHIPYIMVANYTIEPELKEYIPEAFARKYKLIPLDKFGDSMSVVMSDPLNVMLLGQLNQMTGLKISPLVSTKKEIMTAIDVYYRSNL